MSLSRIFATPLSAIAAMAMVAGPMLTPATAQTRRSAPANAPANASLSGDLLLVQRHLEGMHSMTADFSQTDRAGNVQRGRLTLLQPGRIRFQYEPGNPLLKYGRCSAGRSVIRRSPSLSTRRPTSCVMAG